RPKRGQQHRMEGTGRAEAAVKGRSGTRDRDAVAAPLPPRCRAGANRATTQDGRGKNWLGRAHLSLRPPGGVGGNGTSPAPRGSVNRRITVAPSRSPRRGCHLQRSGKPGRFRGGREAVQ